MPWRSPKTTAASELLPLLYGDAPMSVWPPRGGGEIGEPWATFERARDLAADGDLEGARTLWLQIAEQPDIESRHVLQAWSFLRESGEAPAENLTASTLGAVAQVPMKSSHDVLAAYADGSVRYLSHSGKALVVEPPTPEHLSVAVGEWFAIAGQLAAIIGPWEGPLPEVPRGHARVLMLTPSGPRFGQGPYDALNGDPAARAFLGAAAQVLQIVVGLAS